MTRKIATSQRQTLSAIFLIPIILGAASIAGLIIALTGDGWRDGAAWLLLGLPVMATLWALRHRRQLRHI